MKMSNAGQKQVNLLPGELGKNSNAGTQLFNIPTGATTDSQSNGAKQNP